MALYFKVNGAEYTIWWTDRSSISIPIPMLNFGDAKGEVFEVPYQGEVKPFALAFFAKVAEHFNVSAPEDIEDAVIDELFTLLEGSGFVDQIRKG